MGKVYQRIDDPLRPFIEQQAIFFVATAPLAGDGHVNVSPKGRSGSLTVLDSRTVAYLDFGGSHFFGRKTDEQFAADCESKPTTPTASPPCPCPFPSRYPSPSRRLDSRDTCAAWPLLTGPESRSFVSFGHHNRSN